MASGFLARRRAGAPALALLVIAAACTQSASSQTSGKPSSPAPVRVTFNTRGGDAFTWTEKVSGTSECGDVSLADNGQSIKTPVTTKGSRFRAEVPLAPGRNEVVATCGSGGKSAPLIFQARLRPGPKAWIRVAVHGDKVVLDGRSSMAGAPEGAKIVSYSWTRDPRHRSQLDLASGRSFSRTKESRLVLRAPASDGEYYARLTVTDSKGRTDSSSTYFVVSSTNQKCPLDAREVTLLIFYGDLQFALRQFAGRFG